MAPCKLSDSHYRRLFESAQNGILILHASSGQVVDANPALNEILGYSKQDLLGRTLWEACPFKDADGSQNIFAELQADSGLHYDGLHCDGMRLRTKDGRWVQVEFVTHAYEVDETRFIQCHLRDITERLRLSQRCKSTAKALTLECAEKGRRGDELTSVNAELARSNAELENFVQEVTHDLQEPLRGVGRCVELLQKHCEGRLDARAEKLITHAVDGARRMHALIQNLLVYSQASMETRRFATADCETVLDGALANLLLVIEESGAVVTRDALPRVTGDAVLLTQLFQNLISNAIKFRAERPAQIHVGARLQDGGWCFALADNGIGMEPRHFERVFQVFQRLHTSNGRQGTGMGLAICKKVVERHGGRIWVESKFGQGSTFHFIIPEKSLAA